MNNCNIAILLYTYDRVDDARINLEIIKNLWSNESELEEVSVIHTYNGQKEHWKKYLEDELLITDNPGHFAGAVTMINKGHEYIAQNLPKTDYVILLAADTWLVKPTFVVDLIKRMRKESKYLATCAWGTQRKSNIWNVGMSLDFCIYDFQWAMETDFLPLEYQNFKDKYEEILMYEDKMVYPERVLAVQFRQSIEKIPGLASNNLLKKAATRHLLRITEREPVHKFKGIIKRQQYRKMQWPKIGLLGDHNPGPKQRYLKRYFNDNFFGKYTKKLIESNDLSYYNNNKKESYFA